MATIDELFNEAIGYHSAGQIDAARRHYWTIVLTIPTHAGAQTNLGILAANDGDIEQAIRHYSHALASNPQFTDALYNLANLYRRAGQFEVALEQYRECIRSAPDYANAHYNRGLAAVALGYHSEAEQAFREVLRITPGDGDAEQRLGDVLLRAGKVDDSVAVYRKYLETRPNDQRGLYNFGLSLANAGRATEAIEILQRLLKLNHQHAEAHNALGLALQILKRDDDAVFHFESATKLKPDFADAWNNLSLALSEQGRIDNAIDNLRKALTLRPEASPFHSNLLMLLNYSTKYTPEKLRDEHLAWGVRFAEPAPPPPIPHTPHDPARKLRIGYVSSDFRRHSVAGLIETLFAHQDRERFEVFAYCNVNSNDDTTLAIKQHESTWRDVHDLSDGQLVELITQDQIDILVDLNGHTAGGRLLTFALRPSAIQVALYAYPNTTGISAMDYRITDAVSSPDDTDRLWAEKLLRLPDVGWVYKPPVNAPNVSVLPAVARKGMTFGCLNNPSKVNDTCLAAWAKLLQATPGSRLIVMSGHSQASAKRLTEAISKAGILRERIQMVPRQPVEKYFETYNTIDIALDPFPFNGSATSCDALWMGVPVLTLEGTNYVSRQGTMLMTVLDLTEFIAGTVDELIEIGRRWTTRRAELGGLRAGLRQRFASSPLCDGAKYVRNFEFTLREVWTKRLAQKPLRDE